jgi:DNA-binding MarR family transcriptional regulator
MSSARQRLEQEPHVAVLLFVAHRAVEQRVLAALHDAGFDVTLAQGRLFARIPEDGIRLTELSGSAQITKQTAGFLVDQLEAAGYVQRAPDPTDARARLVRIAPRGRQAQALAREVEAQVTDEWTQHVGPRDMAELRRIMERLREITDPFEAAVGTTGP